MKDIISNLTKKQKIIGLIIIIIVILFIFFTLYKMFYSEENSENIDMNETNMQDDSNETTVETEKASNSNGKLGLLSDGSEGKVVIHIVGEVNTPGVYSLPEGSRINDAIKIAGGKTENADLSKINLAYILEDGVQIYVPQIGEKLGEDDTFIREGAGSTGIITESSNIENSEKKTSKVNINTANLEKLKTLSGVGDSTAQKIIDYREKNGKFKKIEDIKNVSGIGDAKFETLKNQICV